MAETLLAEQADRRDTLRLLALVAEGLGARGLRDYRPPSEVLEEALREQPRALVRGAERQREVQALTDLGEVG